MTIQDLRSTFLGFFEERGHVVRPSAPLVLHDDPTSLFTSAGVQPYMAAFRGLSAPPAPRATSCQKCLRTGDIDDVGRYNRYHTFFEMLGNFSFGDYFKQEAIDLAWEFINEVLAIPAEPLWIGVFEEDDEAEELWHKRIGVPMERIRRLGRNDNWWPKVRWEGPCGPCTEIHIDLGPAYGCPGGCDFGCSCNRYLELWNLVFQQFTEAEDGALTPLPAPCIDTGLGLERLGLVMQGKQWSMETDELGHIMATALSIINEDRATPYAYGQDAQLDVGLRVIADHIRGVAFVIADNVVPANEGAGYVIRRLIRRAYRFGRQLGATQPFLYRALPAVGEVMGQAYPEVAARLDYAAKVLQGEEERFDTTLEQGLALFEEIAEDLTKAGQTAIPGDRAFRLNDTYGFPVEVTRELAFERGLTVDEAEFARCLAEQREKSRGKAKGLALTVDGALATAAGKTVFSGHDADEATATVTLIVRDDQPAESASAGDEMGVVLDGTPFYAEKGGQVGDTGYLDFEGGEVLVTNALPLGEGVVHVGTLKAGVLKVGDSVTARVDISRRWDIRRNHTATHLLQAALRKVLGGHVAQSGSHVGPDRLRFDFSHHAAVSPEDLRAAEDLVNHWVMEDIEVCSREMGLDEARNAGATALFGEKYGDVVRAVRVGETSFELCGGTHCRRTGEIGQLRILHEGSVAAGIRRIEAVTGAGALAHARDLEDMLADAAAALGCRPGEVPGRIEALHERVRELQAEVKAAREMSASTSVDDILAAAVDVSGAKLATASVPGADRDALAALADELVQKLGDGVAVLGSVADGKIVLVCKVADSLIPRGGHAGNLVKAVATACGGGGGGRPNFAQAGGTQPEKLDAALGVAAETLAGQLG
jgi:alanyl-tRNA synthetase